MLPLYPYGRRRTVFSELIPGQLWSLEQLQGVYYVAVPVRLTVAKVPGGLMLVNPLPPTGEVLQAIANLEKQHGPVRTIVLPTASGLEHKLPLAPLARAFSDAEIWVCPGQWSFPLPLPLSWLGIPASRTRVLLEDGVPHPEVCQWLSLGPLDLGVGRFQEVSCLHQPSGALLVTDALVGIAAEPPSLFDLDPTPLLFHAVNGEWSRSRIQPKLVVAAGHAWFSSRLICGQSSSMFPISVLSLVMRCVPVAVRAVPISACIPFVGKRVGKPLQLH